MNCYLWKLTFSTFRENWLNWKTRAVFSIKSANAFRNMINLTKYGYYNWQNDNVTIYLREYKKMIGHVYQKDTCHFSILIFKMSRSKTISIFSPNISVSQLFIVKINCFVCVNMSTSFLDVHIVCDIYLCSDIYLFKTFWPSQTRCDNLEGQFPTWKMNE